MKRRATRSVYRCSLAFVLLFAVQTLYPSESIGWKIFERRLEFCAYGDKNTDDLSPFCDLTDVKQAISTNFYDYIIMLGGMEKTRCICEGVRQVQEICRPGGKIFVIAKTPKDISAN